MSVTTVGCRGVIWRISLSTPQPCTVDAELLVSPSGRYWAVQLYQPTWVTSFDAE